MLMVLYSTGMRNVELRQLQVADLNAMTRTHTTRQQIGQSESACDFEDSCYRPVVAGAAPRLCLSNQ